MADDFDDFGDFTSAFPTTGGINDANSVQTTTSTGNQANSADKMNFFASFSPPTCPVSSTSGDAAPLDFAPFDAFSNHTSEGIIDGGEISSFGQFDVANMDLTELKIPSPTDPNIHLAGGVAFDIPPILDDDFSNPSSPTAPPNQVQFQGDLFSADFTKSEANNENSENLTTDVHLSFPTSSSQQSSHQAQVDREDAKDDSFGEFESSLSLKTTLKTSTEPPNMATSNLGPFPDNSVPAASSNMQEVTSTGQVHIVGGDLKSEDEFGEFGDFTQSTGIDKTETPIFTNLGNSLDVIGFANFESTVNAHNMSKQSDTSNSLSVDELKPDAIPLAGDGFAGFDHFQSSEPTKKISQDNNAQLGDFGVFSSSSSTNAQENGFGAFQTQTGSMTTAIQGDTQFGAFSTTADVLKDATAQEDNQFGDFSSSSVTNAKDNDELGSFGAFQAPADYTNAAQDDTQFGDFGAFASSSTTNAKEDDFGNFGAFQTRSDSTAVPSSTANAQSDPPVDDFGAFADSTKKEDDFGDFSMGDSNFGNFASSETAPQPMSIGTKLKGIENLMSECFPGAGSSQDKQTTHTTTQLTSQLLSSKSSDSTENGSTIMVWTTLKKSIDFTIPLQKWDSSYMQDRYFVALKMDPMLVSKAGVLPLFGGMGQFDAPLGGVTALDLLESFGFEGGLEAVTQEPSSPTSMFPFRSGSPGPALLDLSLPISPRSPTNKDASFTLDADLLGLDLNPQSQSKQLTSIQELVLNERLVVNRSTWMDSELLELGGSSPGDSTVTVAGDTSSQTSSRPSTPRTGKKQNSIELQLLQLGLDASKTSLANASSHTELSLTARSTLGRLPDLSFMLQRDKLVRSTYQSGQGAT